MALHDRQPGPAVAVHVVEVGGRHPPRLADRGRTAGHRDRGEMVDPPELAQVGDENLTTPDRAVGPVAEPVERDADYRAVVPVVGQAGGDVGVVVLYPDDR